MSLYVQSFTNRFYCEKRKIIIENINKKHRINSYLTDKNIVIMTSISIFLPFIFTAIIIAFITTYIVINKRTRQLIFVHKGSKILALFFAYSLLIPFYYKNWIGVIIGLGVIIALILELFLRSVMTSELFESALTLICYLSFISTSSAISEKFLIPLLVKDYSVGRISAMFLHPNYFGTIASMVIIICAYKELTRQGQKWIYYLIASVNVISIYLCQSMFAWVDVFLGIAVLLIILKKHRLLAIWFFAATIAAFTILVLNINIIPRLSDAELTTRLRVEIWELAIEEIKKAPFIGHGFLSFSFLNQKYYLESLIPHAHSLYLEFVLNFGIVGTILLLWYFVKYFISVLKICFNEKKVLITSLILAITASVLLHGVIDVTILWIQTLPLYLIILAGYGAYEKSN